MVNNNLKSKQNTVSKVVNCFRTPSHAIISAWSIWLVLYIAVPFYHTRQVSFIAFAIIILSTLLFVLGDLFCQRNILHYHKSKRNATSNDSKNNYSPQLDRLIRNLAIVGIIGACVIIVVKMFLSGLDYSAGVSDVRYKKINMEIDNPFVLYPALLAYPFGMSAFLCSLLQGFNLSKFTINLSKLSALFGLSTTIINGGRAGIFLFIFMILGALLVNSLQGKVVFEKSFQRGNLGFIVLIVMSFILYSTYIAASRRDLTEMSKIPFTTILYEMRVNNGFYSADWVVNLVEQGILNDELVLNIMQFDYYFTHGPVAFTAYLDSNVTSMGPYYGQYQIGLFGVIMKKILPDMSLFQPLFTELGMAGTEGVFLSGWGTIWVDLGPVGLIFQAFIMGYLSRIVYYNAIDKPKNMPMKLIFCFVFASIVLTPIMSPFLMTESLFIFLAILLTAINITRIERTESLI